MCANNKKTSDKDLFNKAMQGVKHLREDDKVYHRTETKLTAKSLPKPEFFVPLADCMYETKINQDTILSYMDPGVQNKVVQRLRNGKFTIEGSLDLHGVNLEQARSELYAFLLNSYNKNKRCILLIHGQGGKYEGYKPVIKSHVSYWLSQLDFVMGFYTALPKDGGSGSLYILLRRNR